MAVRTFEKRPLFRRQNRTAHRAPCGYGGEYRWQRNTKSEKTSEATHAGMGPKHRHGLDYTPLFKFLLSKVGDDWNTVHSDAVSRLDREEPINWIVSQQGDDALAVVRVGESTYFSGLYITPENRLAVVAPEIGVEDIYPSCPCCTHTFNGIRVPNRFDETRANQIVILNESYR